MLFIFGSLDASSWRLYWFRACYGIIWKCAFDEVSNADITAASRWRKKIFVEICAHLQMITHKSRNVIQAPEFKLFMPRGTRQLISAK